MPFEPEIPTLAALVARAHADIDAALGVETPLLDTQPEFVLATNNATMAHGNYLALRRLAKQIIPSADNDADVLEQHARLWLGNDDGRLDASPATLTLVGTGTAGTILPLGTRFRRNSDGALFETTTADLVFETDDIEVTAIAEDEDDAGWGADGNTVPGAGFTLADEVAGLDADWTVDGDPADGAVGGGADEETLSELAERVEFRAQNPPRGGKATDYEAWAREVAGIGQAWCLPGLFGPGTIAVYVVRDDADDPFPDAGLVSTVQDYLDAEAPAQAGTIRALSPVALELDPQIAIKPNTAAIREAATAALEEAIALRATPEQHDNDGIFDRSWLTEALSAVVGETGHTLTSPASDIEVGTAELVRLGTPVFSTKE